MSDQLSPAERAPASEPAWRVAAIVVMAVGWLVWSETLAIPRGAALVALTLAGVAVGVAAGFRLVRVRRSRGSKAVALYALAAAAGVACSAAGPDVLAPSLAVFAGWFLVLATVRRGGPLAVRFG